MRTLAAIAYGIGAAAAIASLSGCSGSDAQVASLAAGSGVGVSAARNLSAGGRTSHRVKSYMRKVDVLTRLAYISDFSNGFVAVFGRNGTQVGAITDGLVYPAGLFVDSKRNLWVANELGQNVLEFARGGTSPIDTLNDSAGFPYDVTMCPNGTIYVSNFEDLSQTTGSIEVYASGSTNPTGALVYPGQGYNDFLTCDAAGNVFTTLGFASSGNQGVVEYPGGNQSGATLLPIGGFPLGIKTDNAGNLLIADPNANTVTEYTEAGAPTGHSIATGSGYWYELAVTRNSRVVLGVDGVLKAGTALTFPAGAHRQSYVSGSFGEPTGAAFDPGQKGI